MLTIKFELSEQVILALLKNEELTLTLKEDQSATETEHHSNTDNNSFFDFFEQNIKQLRKNEKMRTSETYRTALNSLQRFCGDKPLSISEVDAPFIQRYEQYLCANGLSKNTTSFYMRITRAVYNRAIQSCSLTDKHPFRQVYTGVAKTMKRAMSIKYIKDVQQLRLPPGEKAFARDVFLFSFYTRGMSFVDIAYLRKTDVSNGYLTYHRKKTGQKLTLKWEPIMQEIVDRYPSANDFLFPIIKDEGKKARSQYRNMLCKVNKQLVEIGNLIHTDVKLTMYVARHSWASIALKLNIPVELISRGMGHDSEKTTRIYLKSLYNSQLDEANRQVMEALSLFSKPPID